MRIMLKKTSIFLIGIVILSTMLLVVVIPDNAEKARRFLDFPSTTSTSQDGRKARPIMHTFFEPDKVDNPDGEELVKVWEDEWNRIGFETKVLRMKDAKRHPLYKEMKKIVGPVFGETYNGLCFYRWLAMAHQKEGGWMSDFDMFPTNFFKDEEEDGYSLPYDGEFTSWDNHVPSLLSGTYDEWNKVVKLLIEYFPETKGLQSDMMVWMTVRDSQKDKHNIHYKWSPDNIAKGFIYYRKQATNVNCEFMDKMKVVHVSHRQTHEAAHTYHTFPLKDYKGRAEDNRAEAIKIFMNDYREQCKKEDGETSTA